MKIKIEFEDYDGNTEDVVEFESKAPIDSNTIKRDGYEFADEEILNKETQHIRMQQDEEKDFFNITARLCREDIMMVYEGTDIEDSISKLIEKGKFDNEFMSKIAEDISSNIVDDYYWSTIKERVENKLKELREFNRYTCNECGKELIAVEEPEKCSCGADNFGIEDNVYEV